MKNNLTLTSSEVDHLLSPRAIRERAKKVFELTTSNQGHFQFHPEKLKPTVDFVLSVIKKKYPTLDIPFHSRWGHFNVGGINRKDQLLEKIKAHDSLEKARIQLDLVITSVLLDAGAGNQWKYHEASSGQSYGRSEGLGVASLYLFLSGAMSSDKKSLRADREGLKNLTLQELSEGFQVSEKNPLVGTEGRLKLLNNLAMALEDQTIFRDGRPGNIVDYLIQRYGSTIPATGVLRAVLEGLGPIWPGRLQVGSVNLGDVWAHSKLGSDGSFESLVPFHKLSQWLTYSLIEPIQEAGLKVEGVENLTGLAEYRNGGLLIDTGLISARDEKDLTKAWTPDSEFIIEWRALTIHFLDQIGEQVQSALGKTAAEFPLAKVLEGGTWWAGRFIASEKRPGTGEPPVMIKSDGTVF